MIGITEDMGKKVLSKIWKICRITRKFQKFPPHFIYVLCNEIPGLINMKIKFNAFHRGPSNALSLLYENIRLIEVDVICIYYTLNILEICPGFLSGIVWDLWHVWSFKYRKRFCCFFLSGLYTEKKKYGSTRKKYELVHPSIISEKATLGSLRTLSPRDELFTSWRFGNEPSANIT